MTDLIALLDSNVVIACVAEAHEHHASSLAVLTTLDPKRLAIAAHSFAEAYATLTRTGAPFRFTAEEARSALESLRGVTALAGLTPSQTYDTLRRSAASGGVGSRLYDALIGQVAVVHQIPTIVTWNVRHMSSLFPDLSVTTPQRFLVAQSRHRT